MRKCLNWLWAWAVLTVISWSTYASADITVQPAPSIAVMREFLKLGKWSPTADDNYGGEALSGDFVKGLVLAYKAKPDDPQAVANLSLVTLALATAGWGVSPTSALNPDPVAGGNWRAIAGGGDGKHLMSYARGGIGIPHTDSTGLVVLMSYLEKTHQNDLLPRASEKFFKLKGTNFDVLYAGGGNCTNPSTALTTDLDGKAFMHRHNGTSRACYCDSYLNKAQTTPEDWQIFRHGMRQALRKEDVQLWILRNWVTEVWWPSYNAVMATPRGTVQEAMINARIRNSSPATARCALKGAQGAGDASARIQQQLTLYSSDKCRGKKRHAERVGYMMRSVAVYDSFSP